MEELSVTFNGVTAAKLYSAAQEMGIKPDVASEFAVYILDVAVTAKQRGRNLAIGTADSKNNFDVETVLRLKDMTVSQDGNSLSYDICEMKAGYQLVQPVEQAGIDPISIQFPQKNAEIIHKAAKILNVNEGTVLDFCLTLTKIAASAMKQGRDLAVVQDFFTGNSYHASVDAIIYTKDGIRSRDGENIEFKSVAAGGYKLPVLKL